jgi:hypothetical protein
LFVFEHDSDAWIHQQYIMLFSHLMILAGWILFSAIFRSLIEGSSWQEIMLDASLQGVSRAYAVLAGTFGKFQAYDIVL